nr:MAG TPA: hypothetical protein [Caudoviricetes sp.]
MNDHLFVSLICFNYYWFFSKFQTIHLVSERS